MRDKKQIVLWIALAFTVVLGALWQYFPIQDAKLRLDQIPLKGETFTSKAVPLNDFEKSFFKDVNLVKRIFTSNGQSCFITVLDGTRNRHVVHDPYYCFTGGGWKLIDIKQFPINGGYTSLIRMHRGMETKEAMVWFSDSEKRHSSAFKFFLQTTFRRLSLGLSGQEPVLIVIQPIGMGLLNWEKLIEGIPPLQEI